MTRNTPTLMGRCHCGEVRFEVKLTDGFSTIGRCNCSFCRMRGAITASAKMGDVRIVHGHEALTSYRFNTMTAEHFFCSRCGIYTHHRRRSDPDLYGVNVACLDGVSPFDFLDVPVTDGIHHPNDTGGKERSAGTLRFFPTDQEAE